MPQLYDPVNQNCVILVTRNNLVLITCMTPRNLTKNREHWNKTFRILVANVLQHISDANIHVMSGPNMEDLEATDLSNIEFINTLAQYILQTGSTGENPVNLED